jgi:hypothetical protein
LPNTLAHRELVRAAWRDLNHQQIKICHDVNFVILKNARFFREKSKITVFPFFPTRRVDINEMDGIF